jgi:nicotinamidase-related amidase
MSETYEIEAEPYEFRFGPDNTALMVIDMQNDFISEGGFGDFLGNDVSLLENAIEPTRQVLQAAREAGLLVIFTREGHRPDLSNLHPTKAKRGKLDVGIGDEGPNGPVLVEGEWGLDIVDELEPREDEPIIDKPGKGSFYATDLDLILRSNGIKNLIVTGVTTEVCIHTTVREANDRGYESLVLSDCVGSYFQEFQDVGLKMIKAQGGIFGWVSTSGSLLATFDLTDE